MQAVLVIPNSETLPNDVDSETALTQEIAGVPLLLRVAATAARAGVDSVLVVWPDDIDIAVLDSYSVSPLVKRVRFDNVVQSGRFEPRNRACWAALKPHLQDRFLWLPWNWVTHKYAITGLLPSRVRPVTWGRPVLLERSAVLDEVRLSASSGRQTEGVPVPSPIAIPFAERFLVANSGKPSDGIYSKFNRWLCRPFVRLLVHTSVTPNALTLTGLVAAVFAAIEFARGTYPHYVAGAALFFLSGLFDEMDGMVARLKFRESAFGTWFEGFVDNATYLIVFAGITVGLERQYGRWPVNLGVALLIGSLLSFVVIGVQRKLFTSPNRPHEYAGKMNRLLEADSANPVSQIARHIHLFVKKGVLIHYVLIFALMGGLPLFLGLAAFGSNVTWILALYFTYRFLRHPANDGAARVTRTAA
ncbi:MAG TPA: CDP-alcohol phosphatidyltransferase family protein [Bryobacteraceae bacterium]|nr:CDP-alcohol phosphatidyltransferase family protein [Bryobacteraceae bacterium]